MERNTSTTNAFSGWSRKLNIYLPMQLLKTKVKFGMHDPKTDFQNQTFINGGF